jgi:SAM-dependent methyltransferase
LPERPFIATDRFGSDGVSTPTSGETFQNDLRMSRLLQSFFEDAKHFAELALRMSRNSIADLHTDLSAPGTFLRWFLRRCHGIFRNRMDPLGSRAYRGSSRVLILEGAMKTARNDPCHCGSGKKYKKCCLSKDQAAEPAQPSLRSILASASTNVVPKKPDIVALPRTMPPAGRTAAPPAAPDPIAQRADQLWNEFESESEERRTAIFLETLEDTEVMTDSMAFEMLTCLHSDAMKRGDHRRFADLMGALRERLPEIYEESAHYYLGLCLVDALAENRLEMVPSLTRELAARAGSHIDVFNRTVDTLAYHGQLAALVEAFRIGWPGVKSSNEITPYGVSRFMNAGADYEIFDYLERTSSPDPADPVLLDRIRFFVEEPREDYLRDFIGDLSGTSAKEWRVDDFALRPPRKTTRDEWDDDECDEDDRPRRKEVPDPGALNLHRLISEFVSYLHREEGVPFPRAQLVRHDLGSYFLQRHHGELDPRPSMMEAVLNPNKKLPKPPKPIHPLCPERVTLEVFLVRMLRFFNPRFHSAAALFQVIPAWLRFLESRRLIDADVRRKVANDLLPLHADCLKGWQNYRDDPTLEQQGRHWPADAAKGPAEFVPGRISPPAAGARSEVSHHSGTPHMTDPGKDFTPLQEDYEFFLAHSTEQSSDLDAYLNGLQSFSPPPGTIRMLDFGCGPGTFTALFLERVGWGADRVNLSLVEPADAYRRRAVERLEGSAVQPIHASAELPTDTANTFDVILSNHVFYYVSELEASLDRLVRTLKPGGLFLTAIAGRQSAIVDFWFRGFPLMGKPVPYRTAEDLEAVLVRLGHAYERRLVEYSVSFRDTEESRLKILRFLFGEHLAKLPRSEVLDFFKPHVTDGHVEIPTTHFHYSIRGSR